MLGDGGVTVVNAHHAVERDPYRDPAADQRGRDDSLLRNLWVANY